ncbi:peptidase M20 [candidate division KSB1 bacterium]|nr:MAG: peptidase M20 [candidate division KSB1 bacterium]
MISRDRMLEEFLNLIKIDSISKKEGKIGKYLIDKLKKLGLAVKTDDAHKKVGGEIGNIIGYLKGTDPGKPTIIFNAHMDTVTPGEGIKAVVEDDIVRSVSDTILASDDKSGITAILEVLRCLKENNFSYGNIEVVFTICEEIGLKGAKSFDPGLVKGKFGFSLDSTNPDKIVVKAPAANTITFKVEGRSAHAGMAPEQGINAIYVASKAISKMRLGRIDDETTANLGIINGGIARNIVPNFVEIKGEARSHNLEKLETQTKHMEECFKSTIGNFKVKVDNKEYRASYKVDVQREYNPIKLSDDSLPVKLAMESGKALGRKMETIAIGGGSDANIFGEKGIQMVVLGTGMNKPHTKEEYLVISDMVKAAELLLKIVELNK